MCNVFEGQEDNGDPVTQDDLQKMEVNRERGERGATVGIKKTLNRIKRERAREGLKVEI